MKKILDRDFTPHMKFEFHINETYFIYKGFHYFELIILCKKRFIFPDISEKSRTTVRTISYMNYDFDIKRPKQVCELKLSLIFDENPQLINTLDRSVNHPSFRKKFQFLFLD